MPASVALLISKTPTGRGSLCDEAGPSPKTRKSQNRPGPGLEIPDRLFTVEQVQGLIDDWLVPSLVESLLRERLIGREEE